MIIYGWKCVLNSDIFDNEVDIYSVYSVRIFFFHLAITDEHWHLLLIPLHYAFLNQHPGNSNLLLFIRKCMF